MQAAGEWPELQAAAARLPGASPLLTVRAPGRVNLIGDHTDYSDGLCMPAAIDLETRVCARVADHGRIRVQTLLAPGERLDIPADGSCDVSGVGAQWGRYVAAVVTELAALGVVASGIEAVIGSTVPPGSGLSSSAALEVAVALAIVESAGVAHPSRLDIARACQRAEQGASGVPCGVMDQAASVCGRSGHAMLLDCRSMQIEMVALPPAAAVLVMHCGMPRQLAGSEYAERRAACEQAAHTLGVPALRDATIEQVVDDPFARHVVGENGRVRDFAAALGAGDLEQAGQLMAASHASLRDDFRVSTSQLDALVETLTDAGSFGARLTGAGFGGCAVALVPRAPATRIAKDAARRYRDRTGHTPAFWLVEPAAGAGRI